MDDLSTASWPTGHDRASLDMDQAHQYAAHYHQTRPGTTIKHAEVVSLGVQVHISWVRIGKRSDKHQPGPKEAFTTPWAASCPSSSLLRSGASVSTPDGTLRCTGGRSRWHTMLQMAHHCSRWHAATDGWHTAPVAQSFCTVPSTDMCSCTDPSGLNCNAQRSGDASGLLAPDLMLLSSASNGRPSFCPGLSWVRVFISNARRPSKHAAAAKLRFARLTAAQSVCSCRNVAEVERAAAFSSETRPGQWATSHGISPPVLVAATGGDWRLDFPRPRQSWRLAIGVGDLPLKSPASTRASKLPAADSPPVLGRPLRALLQRHGYLFFSAPPASARRPAARDRRGQCVTGSRTRDEAPVPSLSKLG
ncbi:hypothetical protein F5X68DRAFT_32924 [Plectosphaerella plurivora]|uniref:Uncharacterized protein n=1 Tax=Plectosphaerella plurivora TaxID=936078 RepID=A0A9P9A867_9PEZI|nr:hypothetical protein F5X68DRAFT_32924 [Plectosphaerella plurivora]